MAMAAVGFLETNTGDFSLLTESGRNQAGGSGRFAHGRQTDKRWFGVEKLQSAMTLFIFSIALLLRSGSATRSQMRVRRAVEL